MGITATLIRPRNVESKPYFLSAKRYHLGCVWITSHLRWQKALKLYLGWLKGSWVHKECFLWFKPIAYPGSDLFQENSQYFQIIEKVLFIEIKRITFNQREDRKNTTYIEEYGESAWKIRATWLRTTSSNAISIINESNTSYKYLVIPSYITHYIAPNVTMHMKLLSLS